MSAQTLLAKVETAIETILDGGAVQRFTIRGRDISLCSLSELRVLRRELLQEAAEESAGTSIVKMRLRPQ